MATKLQGIDVSKHQGSIDWKKVKESGKVSFVILRAGYGSYIKQKDTTFEYNYSECKKYGIPVGAYWYIYASSVDGAKTEAKTCLEAIKGKSFELPVFMDIEYESDILAQTKQVRTDMCKAFMDAISTAGYKTGLYCSYDFIINQLDKSQLTKYDKWIAQYASACKYSGSDLMMWQYSSKGTVSGISGSVDMDYLYKEIATATAKWEKNGSDWYYKKADGTYQKNDWLKVDDRWYWFDANGKCITGWKNIKGVDYYFAEKAFGSIKECQCMEASK
jgi:GH25 family lysozyme M1 (1,4-beta-N-acetylmuramidase)